MDIRSNFSGERRSVYTTWDIYPASIGVAPGSLQYPRVAEPVRW